MRLFLLTLLVFGGIGFAQYYRHVQVQNWHLTQRNLEARHEFNRLAYKFDVLRKAYEELKYGRTP